MDEERGERTWLGKGERGEFLSSREREASRRKRHWAEVFKLFRRMRLSRNVRRKEYTRGSLEFYLHGGNRFQHSPEAKGKVYSRRDCFFHLAAVLPFGETGRNVEINRMTVDLILEDRSIFIRSSGIREFNVAT